MKRVFDFCGAFIALVALLPVLILVAVLVRLNLGAPVLFAQRRPGWRGCIFTMWKFRSMREARDDQGLLRSDAERLTPFGRKLRASSLDELPELWNILRGEMSFVGPRPLLVEYLPLYSPTEARRHEVRPGLTGWAQINGRNALTWEEKFRLDLWYVDNRTFWLDLKIIGLTVARVFQRTNINAGPEVPMPRFLGSAPLAGDPPAPYPTTGEAQRRSP